MDDVRRDALLAAGSGAALLAVLAAAGALDALADPVAIAAGVLVGVLVEAAFLAKASMGALWRRRGVAPAGAVALVVSAVALFAWVGPLVAAAACWGLVVYFAVLAAVSLS